MTLPFELDHLFRALPCFVTVQGPDLKILAANDLFHDTFGDGAGAFCYAAYKGRTEACEDCPVVGTFEDGHPRRSKQWVRLSDGTELPIIAYSSPVRDESGRLVAVAEISAEISEQVQLERELETSHAQLGLLFEETPSFVSVQDRDLRIVRANRRFREAFGDRIGDHCYRVYKQRDEECLACPVLETFGDGESHGSEELVTSLDGQRINTLVSTAAVAGQPGAPERVMEMSTDITQIRELQGQLANLGILIGSMSHGLKGLLTGLDGGAYLIDSGLTKDQPERVAEGWQMLQRNLGHVRQVVTDLLYLAGEDEAQLTARALHPLVMAAAEGVDKRAADAGITFIRELSDEPGACEVDAPALQKSLTNLLEYALEACRLDQRQVTHRIRYALAWDAENALIEVEDDGLGMDRETRTKVFSPFFASQGTGAMAIGLFTTGKVIEKHRGIIEVDSEPGRGTTFRIRIPRAAVG